MMYVGERKHKKKNNKKTLILYSVEKRIYPTLLYSLEHDVTGMYTTYERNLSGFDFH